MRFLNRNEKLNTREVTTEFVLRDAHGKFKQLWNESLVGRILRNRYGITARNFITGRYANRFAIHNTITNVGHAAANGRMSNQGSYNPFVNLAIGISTQGSPSTATALASEITTSGGARGAATATQTTTTVTNDTTQLVKTYTFTASFSVTEEGIFDSASSGGNMLAYQSFTAIAVASGDQLQITHKYQS